MLTGNNKKFKENVSAFVAELIDLSGYDSLPDGLTANESVRFVACKEKMGEWSFGLFKDWCSGLPSAFDSAAFLCRGTPWDALERLYENTPEESARFRKRVPYDVAADRLLSLCFRELSK